MFKIRVLRELYTLSDEQVEYPIADRLSFQRFLGIDLSHAVPDYTAVWRFREKLKGGVMEELFERLGAYIDLAGFEAKQGQMLDASLVAKPKTRQPPRPKDGEPALTVQQTAHRDADANWTKKHGRSHFGYKNHVNADVAHGFIRGYAVTPAAVHDSQRIEALLDITQRGQGFAHALIQHVERAETPAAVQCIAAVERGDAVHVTGRTNRFIKSVFKLMPDRLALRLSARQAKRYRAQDEG